MGDSAAASAPSSDRDTVTDGPGLCGALGILGHLVERLVLASYMQRLIERRNLHLQSVVR